MRRLIVLLLACFIPLAFAGCGGGSGSGGGGGGHRVVVTIMPVTSTISVGQPEAFTAGVTGTTNFHITWSVAEGAAGGSIDGSGVYTAPATPGTYHVVVTSQADVTAKATATVTVQPVVVTTGSASGTIQ